MTSFHAFRETMWTLIRQARAGDSTAVNDFITRYRPAVTTFLVREGLKREEAEDIAQDIFLTLFENHVLARVEKGRGRFRSFLIAVSKNVLRNHLRRERAEKRGGGAEAVSLDGNDLESILADPAAGGDDETFDHLWVINLLRLAMTRLEEESRRRGIPYAASLRLVVEGGQAYQEAAAKLQKSENDIRNYVHRARQRMVEYVREEVARYACDSDDYEREIAYLERLLERVRHAPG